MEKNNENQFENLEIKKKQISKLKLTNNTLTTSTISLTLNGMCAILNGIQRILSIDMSDTRG